MEADYRTEAGPPLLIGGIPNDETGMTGYALRIPHGLSLILAHRWDATVAGLDETPRRDWPNVRVVHWAFDLMVGCGMVLLLLVRHGELAVVEETAGFPTGSGCCGRWWRPGLWGTHRHRDRVGWSREAGRQPWIIYGVMRTEARR